MKEYELEEDEYFLKVRENIDGTKTGFLAKLTQKGELPKAFENWESQRWYGNGEKPNYPVEKHRECFYKGWKLHSWRFGKSQNWARMIHPAGFTLEIYLDHFLDIVKEHNILEGELQGEFKWKDNKLISAKR